MSILTVTRALAAVAVLATAGGAAGATPAADTATVHIKNFAFVPKTLTVRAGTTVTFVNDDEEPHTATAADKSFDSEALDQHATWKHVFDKAGTYAYFCELHPYMKATIEVSP